ncbi:hypothetical protein Q31b_11780 [Novipirellula aureliae]|uniref:Uncharacterized protein n=1 Tax=Novipirellula aureliae TaxID=2527966 RepID=A0A5C6EBB9_9BACT|nr:hypothetical protein [Novipirellula aureliae]TWU46000.1 hypothetical protein Q31b_11780 [Novipirellula aureliae]
MPSAPQPNPYAPSAIIEEEEKAIEPRRDAVRISNYTVGFNTIFVVILSGGLFGMVLACFVFGSELLFRAAGFTDPSLFEALLSILYFAAIAFGFGMVTAAFAAVPMVPACLWMYSASEQKGKSWTPSSIRIFGSISGAVSGYACVAVPALFSGFGMGVLFGFVPAMFAAISVPIMLAPLAKRCRIALEKEESERRQEPMAASVADTQVAIECFKN